MTNEATYIPVDEFERYLARYNLTNANAARIFGVTPPTITMWLASGVTGTAAIFIRFLMSHEIPPQHVAEKLGMRLSNFRREQFQLALEH